MDAIKGRASQADVATKGTNGPGGSGFGNEIERMLLDRPTMRHSSGGAPPGSVANTLDDLMAELGMLRSGRCEPPSVSPDRPPAGRGSTRSGPRMSDGNMLGSGGDLPLRPITPRTSLAAASPPLTSIGGSMGGGSVGGGGAGGGGGGHTPSAPPGGLVLPPAKGALLPAVVPSLPISGGPISGGPMRAQSPMASRRSATGGPPGPPCVGAPMSPMLLSAPCPGVVERQAQLETRVEKMEAREQQLTSMVAQLQQQLAALSRAQQQQQHQAQQQQQQQTASSSHSVFAHRSPAGEAAAAAAADPPCCMDAPESITTTATSSSSSSSDDDSQQRRNSTRGGADNPPPPPSPPQQQQPLATSAPQAQASPAANATATAAASGLVQRQGSVSGGPVAVLLPVPPTTADVACSSSSGGGGGGGGGRPNKLVPAVSPAAEWEADMSELRREVATLAANVVRLREQVGCLVPGGPSPLAEEVAAQGAAAGQLKQNLTQIAMDVVSLHKSLTAFKQNTERAHAAFEKAINDVQLQAQTNALNMLASGPSPGMAAAQPNAVAAALAATGGVSGTLEESLRCAFAKPAVRALPTFNPAAAADVAGFGFMPDNSGAAAAVAAFGDMAGGGGGGGGQRRGQAPAANGNGNGGGGGGGGGLGAAWALLSSFEEQAAAEKEEQQKAAIITRQAVSLVDAKVRQVVLHVDRHMAAVAADVEERLRMYEQTIIRMAQQIDRVQRVLREMDGASAGAVAPRIVVRHGGREVEGGACGAGSDNASNNSSSGNNGGGSGSSSCNAPSSEMAAAAVATPGEGAHQGGAAAAEGGAAAAGAATADAKPSTKDNWVKTAAMATGRFIPQKEEKKPAARPSPHGYFRPPPP